MVVDPHHLASFLAIVETGSVTEAAKIVGLQQPAVSLHLRALRERFGDPLFIRHAGRMLPTPRALALADDARDVLDRLERLAVASPAFDAATSDRSFRLAMTDASQVTLLPTILNHFGEHAPGISLVVELIGENLAADLVAGRVHMALGYIPWIEDCRQRALYSQDWVCLRRRGGKDIDLAAYGRMDHVTVASGTGGHLLEEAIGRAGIVRNVRLSLPGFLGLAAVIAERDLLATLPRHTGRTLAGLDHRLQIFDLPFKADSFRVAQYWHERYDRDPGITWLREVLQALFGGDRVAG